MFRVERSIMSSNVLAVMLAVLVLAIACRPTAEVTLNAKDNGRQVEIERGRMLVVSLEGNPTTGYNWEESHDAGILSLVEEEYRPDEKAPGLVGAGGTQYFRFKALKVGSAAITLTYKRRWETESIDQKVFNVVVQ